MLRSGAVSPAQRTWSSHDPPTFAGHMPKRAKVMSTPKPYPDAHRVPIPSSTAFHQLTVVKEKWSAASAVSSALGMRTVACQSKCELGKHQMKEADHRSQSYDAVCVK